MASLIERRWPLEDASALHAACRRAPQMLRKMANALDTIQRHGGQQGMIELRRMAGLQLQRFAMSLRTCTLRLLQALAAGCRNRGVSAAQVEAMGQILADLGRFSDYYVMQIASRLARVDRFGVALLCFAALIGRHDANLVMISSLAAKVAAASSRKDAIRLSLGILLAAQLPVTVLRVVLSVSRRISKPLFGERLTNLVLQRLPDIVLKVAWPYAAASVPDLSTFRPQPAHDAQKLQCLLRPIGASETSDHAQEMGTVEPCFSESFGLFTLVAVPNPLTISQPHPATGLGGSDSDRDLEVLLSSVNDANPASLYYIGAYDHWFCVSVGLAHSTLYALRIVVGACMLPQRIMWGYLYGGSALLPPPDYSPFPADDPEQLCTICLEHRKDSVMRPCGHLCVCWGCGQNVQDKCPVCRGRVLAVDYIGRVYH